MLASIQRFLFGARPHPDLNTISHSVKEPPAKGGLLRVNQRAVGDLWVDTDTMRLATYRWDGVRWVLITNDTVDA